MAAVTALGPGITVTLAPASSAIRTALSPGSATAGVPASVTSATVSPASSLARSSPRRRFSLPT